MYKFNVSYKHTFIRDDVDAVNGRVSRVFEVMANSRDKAVDMLKTELILAYNAFDINIKTIN